MEQFPRCLLDHGLFLAALNQRRGVDDCSELFLGLLPLCTGSETTIHVIRFISALNCYLGLLPFRTGATRGATIPDKGWKYHDPKVGLAVFLNPPL